MDFNNLIICSFGRENDILKNLKIKKEEIIIPQKVLNFDSINFSKNITILTRTLKYAYFTNLKQDVEIFISNIDERIAKYCHSYMMLNNFKPLKLSKNKIQIDKQGIVFIARFKDESSIEIPFYLS